jgi:hypothetical protein
MNMTLRGAFIRPDPSDGETMVLLDSAEPRRDQAVQFYIRFGTRSCQMCNELDWQTPLEEFCDVARIMEVIVVQDLQVCSCDCKANLRS